MQALAAPSVVTACARPFREIEVQSYVEASIVDTRRTKAIAKEK